MWIYKIKVEKMALPGNGIFVVRGEMSTLMTAMKRGAARWNSTSYQVGILYCFAICTAIYLKYVRLFILLNCKKKKSYN